MIEDLLERNISPTETAQALVNFLTSELPAGGHTAELRFLRFFPSLCDCIFGKIKEDHRFNTGGWMTLSNKPGTSVLASSLGSSSNTPTALHRTPPPVDPIVVLLTQELLPAITSEQFPHAAYKFPFLVLPEQTQQAWLAYLELSLLGAKPTVYLSENQITLFRSSQQDSLVLYRRNKLQGSDPSPRVGRTTAPMFAATPTNRGRMTSPTMNTKPTSPAKTEGKEATSPDIMLNTIQYYAFQMLLFPLAEPIGNNSVPGFRGRQPPMMVKKESYGESLYYQAFGSTLRYFLPYDKEHTTVPEFLRILMALWLETQKIDPTATLTRRMNKIWDLEDSWDLVRATYNPPCSKVQKCLRTLVVRLIADPALPHSLDRSWCLSPTATALQQSFYNMIRTTFRHASIHVPSSPFHSVLDLWLIWLEPWNVVDKPNATKRDFSPRNALNKNTKSGSTRAIPVIKYNQPSKYSSNWEPYVAANLYFYLVPLAIFLRRARELDFSANRFEASLMVVARIMRVYSPELLRSLQRLLNGELELIIAKHQENLEPFAPPRSISLASLRPDLQKLLEEVYMERNKRSRELGALGRAFVKVEGMLSGNNDEKVFELFLDQSRLLGQWGDDFPGASTFNLVQSPSVTSALTQDAPERTSEGTLSMKGREEVLNGWVKCNPTEIPLKGDPMRVAVKTYELSFVVGLTLALSDHLNENFGFSEKSAFRFNLRFLADYRNLLATAICCYIAFRRIC
ncbi:hypothetical protein FisN_1Lh712 [Fistulifera solaris]|uniref:Sphingomyelin phosphodiesterase 4 n=1 Tax=Fistulifera solaris TaxID=1519565 RepID=A0A1Z5KKA3_FISSO|nr:hypothetical protein FisN_1Lh712 [Fistulifera solaris]|eukprot:GAX26461.1 hypothetical protein FisN_1Lh712 [Fistulifera solaris]